MWHVLSWAQGSAGPYKNTARVGVRTGGGFSPLVSGDGVSQASPL